MARSLVVLIADGLRPDVLQRALAAGQLPGLAGLKERGTMHEIVSAFPSVTGAAYIPMLAGLHPGRAGVPGLRWFDRTRRIGPWRGHSRSYIGPQLRLLPHDLYPEVRTLFQVAGLPSLGLFALVTRGLPSGLRLERGVASTWRAAYSFLTGNVSEWIAWERRLAATFVEQVRRLRPVLAVAAFQGTDKAAHLAGSDSPLVLAALRTLDWVSARLREDAERDGRWRDMRIWVVSDHGHAPLEHHDDLASGLRRQGLKVLSHPWAFQPRADVAVMVSGNSMAHVYVELQSRRRHFWDRLSTRWKWLAAALLQRPSVDLLALQRAPGIYEVRSAQRGKALIVQRGSRFCYRPLDGDPLDAQGFEDASPDEVLERTFDKAYPDAPLQIAELVGSERSGDLILSARPGWDFRDRYEPIPHVSTHGALRREQMVVPFIVDAATQRPRRSIDLFPSAARYLGRPVPEGTGGTPFV
jgi:hypothetical protein